MEMIGAAFRRPFVIEPMSDVFSDLIQPVRAGLPENSLETSGVGQIANCLTTEPWSAVGRIADPQPHRASFPSKLCLLIPLITAAVPTEQFQARLRLNNATRLSRIDWLWSAKRA